MTGHVNPDWPCGGAPATDGGEPDPARVPGLDDYPPMAVVWSGLLIGGEPGSGKSVAFNLAAVRKALDGGGHADAGS